MILELRLKNFYSLRDEQVLDMQAADYNSPKILDNLQD